MTEQEFKIMHSELIAYFQVVDRDIKTLYLYLTDNHDASYGLAKLAKKSISDVAFNISNIDKVDDLGLLDDNLYEYLNNLPERIKYWCSECYKEFLYTDNCWYNEAYNAVALKLEAEMNQMEYLSYRLAMAKLRYEKIEY